MTLKQEIFRIIVLVFAIGFFLLGYIASKTGQIIFVLYAVISLSISIVLAVYVGKKGLEPKNVKERREWIEKGMPIFFIPLMYGLALVCFTMGIIYYITTKQTNPLIGLTILAIIVASIARWIQHSLKSKK